MTRTVALLATVLLGAVACSSGSSGLSEDEARELAEAALIVLGDLPDGPDWSEEEPDGEDEELLEVAREIDACAGFVAFEATEDDAVVALESPDFSTESGGAAASEARVFDDEDAASEVLALLDADELADCIAAALSQLIVEDAPPDAEFGEPRASARPADVGGDDSVGARMRIPLSAGGVDVELVFDAVAVRVGPVIDLFTFLAVGGPPPGDPVMEASVVRVRDALAE